MPKILLTDLPAAIEDVVQRVKEGVLLAKVHGAVDHPPAIEFDAEIVLTQNYFTRTTTNADPGGTTTETRAAAVSTDTTISVTNSNDFGAENGHEHSAQVDRAHEFGTSTARSNEHSHESSQDLDDRIWIDTDTL